MRSATSTSGSSASCPIGVRDSLTRYSWLLFRGEVESAVLELMRWLAPGPETDIATTRWQLIRIHQAFLYDTVADRMRTTVEAPGPAHDAENPYSKLAVDILDTIRVQQLTMSAEHRRLPQDAGHARDAPALAGRRLRPAGQRPALRETPRAPAGARPARSAPRRSTGCTPAPAGSSGRSSSSSSSRRRSRSSPRRRRCCSGTGTGSGGSRQRLIGFGTAVLVVGGLLYLVLVFPDDTRRMLPGGWTTRGSSWASWRSSWC